MPSVRVRANLGCWLCEELFARFREEFGAGTDEDDREDG